MTTTELHQTLLDSSARINARRVEVRTLRELSELAMNLNLDVASVVGQLVDHGMWLSPDKGILVVLID